MSETTIKEAFELGVRWAQERAWEEGVKTGSSWMGVYIGNKFAELKSGEYKPGQRDGHIEAAANDIFKK